MGCLKSIGCCVIPVQTGIYNHYYEQDSHFRGNDKRVENIFKASSFFYSTKSFNHPIPYLYIQSESCETEIAELHLIVLNNKLILYYLLILHLEKSKIRNVIEVWKISLIISLMRN